MHRCFITGPAEEINAANEYVANRGDDPNVPKDGSTESIWLMAYDTAVPVHNQCLHCIPPRVLAHEAGIPKDWVYSSMADITLDKLYHCVEQTFDNWDKVLRLDYYEASKATIE